MLNNTLHKIALWLFIQSLGKAKGTQEEQSVVEPYIGLLAPYIETKIDTAVGKRLGVSITPAGTP